MIVFLNTDTKMSNVIPYKELSSISCYEISFKNKALIDKRMLEKITSFIEAMSYEENKFLLVINDLDDAFMNIEDSESIVSNNMINTFTMLMNHMISIGHDIVYFTDKVSPTIQHIVELSAIDGFDIIDESVKLYNRLIADIK